MNTNQLFIAILLTCFVGNTLQGRIPNSLEEENSLEPIAHRERQVKKPIAVKKKINKKKILQKYVIPAVAITAVVGLGIVLYKLMSETAKHKGICEQKDQEIAKCITNIQELRRGVLQKEEQYTQILGEKQNKVYELQAKESKIGELNIEMDLVYQERDVFQGLLFKEVLQGLDGNVDDAEIGRKAEVTYIIELPRLLIKRKENFENLEKILTKTKREINDMVHKIEVNLPDDSTTRPNLIREILKKAKSV